MVCFIENVGSECCMTSVCWYIQYKFLLGWVIKWSNVDDWVGLTGSCVELGWIVKYGPINHDHVCFMKKMFDANFVIK